MSNLHRTQIYIEKDQMARIKFVAEKEQIAISELIRRAIKIFLEEKEKRVNWEKDPLTKAVGKIKLTVTDASVNHDQYLYGKKKGR